MPGLVNAGALGAKGDGAVEPLVLGPALRFDNRHSGKLHALRPGTEAARSTSLRSAPYLRSRFLCPWRRLSG